MKWFSCEIESYLPWNLSISCAYNYIIPGLPVISQLCQPVRVCTWINKLPTLVVGDSRLPEFEASLSAE